MIPILDNLYSSASRSSLAILEDDRRLSPPGCAPGLVFFRGEVPLFCLMLTPSESCISSFLSLGELSAV